MSFFPWGTSIKAREGINWCWPQRDLFSQNVGLDNNLEYQTFSCISYFKWHKKLLYEDVSICTYKVSKNNICKFSNVWTYTISQYVSVDQVKILSMPTLKMCCLMQIHYLNRKPYEKIVLGHTNVFLQTPMLLWNIVISTYIVCHCDCFIMLSLLSTKSIKLLKPSVVANGWLNKSLYFNNLNKSLPYKWQNEPYHKGKV